MVSITSKLGISPVSLNVIDSVILYSKIHQVQLMLVASLPQVNRHGGYVMGFTPRDLVAYVRRRNNNVLICRDHLGPCMGVGESKLEPAAALEQAMLNLEEDVAAGFDLIHIDCGRSEHPYEDIAQLIERALSLNPKIQFEVGTEENVGVATSLHKFKTNLGFITSLTTPTFVVGQTGSLVKEVRQVGNFNPINTRALVKISHGFEVRFKEHNVDYSNRSDLYFRKWSGVDAINVGPELGVIQTHTVCELARRYGFHAELEAFLKLSLESERWRKWIHDNPSNLLKSVMAGHYMFDSDEYRVLIRKLAHEVNVNRVIDRNLMTLLGHYVGGLS